MSKFLYQLEPDDPALKRLGLIVLQVDETIEEDFRHLLPTQSARLHITRIASGAELTPQTIAAMADEMTACAALLPDAPFDCIAYACTSGTTLIGAEQVASRVRAGRASTHVTNPLTAALAAIDHLGITSLAIVSPYIASVATPIKRAFQAHGIKVVSTVSFGEKIERNVARISADSIRAAARHAVEQSGAQAVFLSCTNLRTLDLIAPLEAELDMPVLASNQVLAWHMAKLSGISLQGSSAGRLFG